MTKKRRVKKKQATKEQVIVAIAWYKPAQWLRLKEISEDGDQLEETFDEWLINAEKALKNIAAQRVSLRKIEVDVDELVAWCKDRDLPINAESRSHYAAWLSQEIDKKMT